MTVSLLPGVSLFHILQRCLSASFGLFQLLCWLSNVGGQEPQSFSRQPANTSVVQGQNATLFCEVQNMGGTMGWNKDVQILGIQRDLPGYPRYSMIGDPATAGNLFIQSAELSDDDHYTCQVFPAVDHPYLISEPALLTVQVPPASHTIDDHSDGDLITIQPPATLNLTCRSTNGKPAATLTWLKNDEPLIHVTPTSVVETVGDGKLQNAISTLPLLPEKEDNGIKFGCKMEHPALSEPTIVSVILNVLFPPWPPLINGYTEGTILRTNDEIRLDCSSRGGNPLAEVYWYKNGERMDYSYNTDGVSARNSFSLVVGYGDNNAVFRCEAASVVLAAPMAAQVTLTVQYAPAYLNITGHENMVNTGDSVTLTCTTGNSNPAASITWLTEGRAVSANEDVITEASDGGFITSQTLTVAMTAEVRRIDYICQATNQALHETVHKQITVSVMYPPNPPTIAGYTDGEVRAGTLLRLDCYSYGGNPLATLQWYKNGQALESEVTTGTASVSAKLTITLKQTDNGALYQCNVSNTATPQPLQANVTLDVLFPPESVNVTARPEVATEGERVVIKCVTASSNPESEISWWRDGVPFGGENVSPSKAKDGANGGRVTSSKVIVETLTWQNDGGVYLCRAMNELLEESVNDGLTLDVRYTPIITTPSGLSVTRREVPGVIKLNCSAHGNPTELTYTWNKDGAAVSISGKYTLTSEGSLHIQDATRAEAGSYECVVSNTVGQASNAVTVNIEYAPTVTTGNSITITLGIDQELACTADANPRPDGFITWSRQGFDISLHTAEFRDGQGFLRIGNVTKSDAGMYTCHADNGIEPANEKDINVLIQYTPEIDYSIPNKVAKSTGQTALMRCHAEGSPVVRFRWKHHGKEVNLTSGRFTLDNRQHSRYTNDYESRLIIGQVEIFDYGIYICEAYNDLGTSAFHINLERTSSPDAPTDLKILGHTHRTVTLNWTAGFDGGLPQSFRVRFNTKNAKQYQYIDVDPPNATYFIMENLNPQTYYEFTVRGMNALGDGPYFHGIKSITTKARPIVPTIRPPMRVGSLPLYAVLLLAFVIIISCMFLNFLLCCCLVKRRFAKSGVKAKKAKSDMELVKPGSEAGRSSPPATESTGSRRGSEDYSYDDSRHYDYGDYRSYDSRFDDDEHRPIADLDRRDTLPSYYNSGYPRKPPYQPGWGDSYRTYPGRPGPGSYVSDTQGSEELEDMDYADTLRRKSREYPRSATPSPVPSSLGNYVPLPKGGPRPIDLPPSQEGFLV